jgi:hypothetical protein
MSQDDRQCPNCELWMNACYINQQDKSSAGKRVTKKKKVGYLCLACDTFVNILREQEAEP